MRKIFTISLMLLFSLFAIAQNEVRIGKHTITPPANAKQLITSKSGLSNKTLSGNQHYVLIQFSELPNAAEHARLKKAGVQLGSYINGNAYFATLSKNNLAQQIQGSNIRSIVPIEAEWKYSQKLFADIPEWARVGANNVEVNIYFAQNTSKKEMKNALESVGISDATPDEMFGFAKAVINKNDLQKIASLAKVLSIKVTDPPASLFNNNGRLMGRVNVVGKPATLNGRELTGKGVKVGVWDGNVESHVDYGKRLHQQEFEMSAASTRGHGMHVSGSVAGAGILDPMAKGMAPEVELYTYNFNVQSNKLEAYQEMAMARKKFNISLTQNSYGLQLGQLCRFYDQLSYSIFSSNYHLDHLQNIYPTLTHVFAAGNDFGACGKDYGSSSSRLKNAIYVGAVDKKTAMSDFSSWGPMDDGRLIPTVSTHGVNVYSTLPNNLYGEMSGTSMACPTATGQLALITERYMQLNNNTEPLASLLKAVIANTAEDRGNKGPDYSYGYGIVNAEKAVKTIENAWYQTASISAGDEAFSKTITAPAGTKQLRVMIVWTDAASSATLPYGQSVLINNLDLRIGKGNAAYRPYVLDPANPAAPATKGIDNINNIEQVVIDNPSGEYTIYVDPTTITTAAQEFSLVYWFEQPALRLIYPNGGEVLQTGQSLDVHFEKKESNSIVKVEISYDSGKTYKTVASAKGTQATIDLDAETNSNNVLLRISDGQRAITSQKTFSVIGVPQKVAVKTSDCGTEGWELSWKKATGITKYQVVKYNNETTKFDKIADVEDNTEATSVKFTIPKENVTVGKRNVYAVQSVFNQILSERSKGVLTSTSQPLQIASIGALPFAERFAEYPSKYITVAKGDNMVVRYVETIPGMEATPGSHMMGVITNEEASDWQNNDPYATITNKTTLRICEVDLTTVATGSKVAFKLETYLSSKSGLENSQYRVKADDAVINSMNDLAAIIGHDANGDIINAVYDLSSFVGKKVKLEIEYVAKTKDELFILLGAAIEKQNDTPDLFISYAKTTREGENLSNAEPISIVLENNSNKTIKNVAVGYTIQPIDAEGNNEGEPRIVSETLNEVKPYDKINYNFNKKADLSTIKPFGQKFKVTVNVNPAENETNLANNKGTLTVKNYGNVVRTNKTGSELFLGRVFPVDPKRHVVVDGSVTFTDVGGGLENYLSSQESSVFFKPKNEKHILKIVFTEFDTDEGDSLSIFLQDFGGKPMIYRGKTPDFVLKGKKDLSAQPLTYLTKAKDGTITVLFKSDRRENAKGWIASVSEVPVVDIYELTEIISYLGTHFTTPQTVTLKLNNKTGSSTLIEAAYRINGGEWIKETKEIASGSQSFAFDTKATFPQGNVKIEAKILSEDMKLDNNEALLDFINTAYCVPTKAITKPEELKILTATLNGKKENLLENTASVDYFLESKLTYYKQQSNEQLAIGIRNSKSKTGEIKVWADLNKDNQFQESEMIGSGTFTKYGTIFKLDLNVPQTTEAGEYYMRIMIAEAGKAVACLTENLTHADIKDLTLKVIDEAHPAGVDYSVSDLVIKPATTGLYTNQQEVKVTINNLGNQIVENFKISIKVNDKDAVEETVTKQIAAFTGSHEYTFTTKPDLSAVEAYKVSVKVEVEGDTKAANNEITKTLYQVIPEENGFYALEIHNSETVQESINLGNLNNRRMEAGTIETWVKVEDRGLNHIFRGKGLLVTTFNKKNNKFFHENSLVVQAGDGFVATEANVIKPGQWQHIAISFRPGGWFSPSKLNVFIDGVKVKTKTYGNLKTGGKPKDEMLVASMFDGMIDRIRLWDTYKTSVDPYKTYTGNACYLCPFAEFLFDEGPTNIASKYDKYYAVVNSKRTPAGENSVWQTPTDLFGTANFERQASKLKKIEKNKYSIALIKGTETNAVKGTIVPAWKPAKAFYKGVEVNETTVFDFSGNGNEIAITMKMEDELFGKKFPDQTFTIKAESGPSDKCEIEALSFQQNLNPGLTANINVDVASQTILVEKAEGLHLSAAMPTISLSDGATATINNAEFVNNGTTIDLNRTALITVLAENKVDSKTYSIALAQQEQTITWANLANLSYSYGDSEIALTATATSELPINYVSSDNSVVTVAGNKMIFVGVGTAKISATQDGNTIWKAATPIEQTITVTPKALTVKPNAISIAFTDEIPAFTYTFTTLLDDSHAKNITLPEYQIIPSGGSGAWSIAQGHLPEGTHTLKPKSSTPFTAGSYTVTPENGEITVNANAAAHQITFNVKDDATPSPSNVVAATIQVEGISLTTDAQGSVKSSFVNGTYSYTVSKADHETTTGEFTVNNATTTVDVTLPKFAYNLDYSTADATMGVVSGVLNQRVKKDGTGSTVVASAKAGFKFVKWNDNNNTEPVRTDKNVSSDVTAIANFSALQYTLTYEAGIGGTIEDNATQTVNYGANGVAVTAKASTGFSFSRWSDGVTDNPRTDKNITEDFTVTAEFSLPYTLPYTENFDNSNQIPSGFEVIKEAAGGNKWELATGPKKIGFNTISMTKHFAYIDGDLNTMHNSTMSSPKIDISNLKASADLSISFDYILRTLKHFKPAFVVKCLMFNAQGDLTKTDTLVKYGRPQSTGVSVKKFDTTLVNASLSGISEIQLQWNYSARWDYYAAIDNINVDAEVSSFNQIYIAGENGKVNNKADVVRLGVNSGINITATANSGYSFDKWSDGNTVATRNDDGAVNVTAYFKSNSTPPPPTKTYHNLSYTAGTNGMIKGIPNQKVEAGQDGVPVEAVGNIGYKFKKWSDNNTDNPRSDKNISNAISVAASFTTADYTVQYKINASQGTLTGNASQSVGHGGDATAITVVPAQGYRFVKWNDGVTDNPRSDKNVTAAIDVTAELEVIPFTLNYTADANGTLQGKTVQEVATGGNGEAVKATPNFGYKFAKWSDGVTDNPRTDENVKADITVTAEFIAQELTLTYSAGLNGTIKGSTTQKVAFDTDGESVKAVANEGYQFVKWSDGVTDNPRTDKSVYRDINVTAQYSVMKLTLTYHASANGKVLGRLLQNIDFDSNGTEVEAIADEGYQFVKWSDGVTDNPRTDKNVKANVNVTAEFEVITYTLTYKADANGSISGNTPQTVNYGTDGEAITAVANEGYKFVKWSDGVTDNPRSDKNVKANVNVTAEFEGLPQTLTIATVANGTITATPSEGIVAGTEIVLTTKPSEGYRLKAGSLKAHKTGDEATTVAITDSKFTMPGFDVTITAEFEALPQTVTFTVLGKNAAAIKDATIAISEKTLTTDDKGIVSIDLTPGEYDYTVKKEGFVDYSNKIKVEKDSLKVAVNLIKVGITSEFAQIQVMPNPVSDKLILKGIEHITSIEIYSLTGKLNKKIEVSFLKRTTIDVSDFNSGVYIIKLSNQKGENHLLKIVKE